MLCRLCFKEPSQILQIFDRNGEEQKIAIIIEQHCLLKVRPDDQLSTVVCSRCWVKLLEFHEFYLEIQEAQTRHGQRLQKPQQEKHDQELEEQERMVSNDIKVEMPEELCPESYMETVLTIPTTTIDGQPISHDLLSQGYGEGDEESDRKMLNPLYEPEVDGHLINHKDENDEGSGSQKDRKRKRDKSKKKKFTPDSSEEDDDDRDASVKDDFEEDSDSDASVEEEQKKRKKKQRTKKSKSKSPNQGKTENPPASKKKLNSILANFTSPEDDAIIKKHIPLGCQLCAFHAESFDDIKKHFDEQHPQTRTYLRCCGKKLKGKSMVLQHALNHENPGVFKCLKCQKTFNDAYQLSAHNRAFHAPEEDLKYACDQCDKKFARQHLLNLHKPSHIPPSERQFICDQCPHLNAFASKHLLSIHFSMRHKRPTNVCHVCGKEIRDKPSFEKHVRLHFEDSGPRLRCPYEECDSWLKDEDNLKQHIRRMHLDQLDLKCNFCEKRCRTRRALNSHVNYAHSGKTYSCDLCEKTFKKQISLKEHMAQHTGESLYKCPFCERLFNSNANMHSHKKKMHPVEWDIWRKTKKGSSQTIISQTNVLRAMTATATTTMPKEDVDKNWLVGMGMGMAMGYS